MNAFERYKALSKAQQREVHLAVAEQAERYWRAHVEEENFTEYMECVVGTIQALDWSLPADAIDVVRRGIDDKSVGGRYIEPIVSMRDDDLYFGDRFDFAYYGVYNLYRLYLGTFDDDWLIVNQSISAFPSVDEGVAFLKEVLSRLES